MKRASLCVLAVVASSIALGVWPAVTSADASSLTTITSAPMPVQSGYDASEQFCGPLGEIRYVVEKKDFRLSLQLRAAKAHRQYEIIWRNNNVRGYTIGAFSTNDAGNVRPATLRMFRPGEVRGAGVRIYFMVGNYAKGVQNFKPCT